MKKMEFRVLNCPVCAINSGFESQSQRIKEKYTLLKIKMFSPGLNLFGCFVYENSLKQTIKMPSLNILLCKLVLNRCLVLMYANTVVYVST